MNRRHLLKAMLSVPVAGALGGCRHEHSDHHRFPPSGGGGTLQVILQGPFAVVINDKDYTIKAFVPYTHSKNPQLEHEFRYAVPFDRENKNIFRENGKRNKYHFALKDDYLEPNNRMPHIDAGFADFRLSVNGWKADKDDYFVMLDLPAPELITYRSSDPLQLGFLKGDKAKKLVALRTSHVLQYRVRDFNDLKKVTVHPPDLEEKHPISCADLRSGAKQPSTASEPAGHDRMERMATEFDQCSNNPIGALFFGVGLQDSAHDTQPVFDHAVEFYNNRLLAAFLSPAEKEQRLLLDANVQACGSGAGGNPMFVSAVQRYSMPQPRLVPVTSLTDCRASGITVTNHS